MLQGIAAQSFRGLVSSTNQTRQKSLERIAQPAGLSATAPVVSNQVMMPHHAAPSPNK